MHDDMQRIVKCFKPFFANSTSETSKTQTSSCKKL